MERYGILDRINDADDIKDMSYDVLDELCSSLRQFIIHNVSKTGGHLASNLGIVELGVALEKVFDSKTDRIVFDVGHQSYVHKILTGRKNDFHTLRTYGGISGFTKPSESPTDASISGHASTSVSTALGMARARTLTNKKYDVVAVIGDGALTGGMAYEALSNAGASKEPLIVILNDNNMSITKNVGAMSKHLANLRVRPRYLRLKKSVKDGVFRLPHGKSIANGITSIKTAVKSMMLPSSLFEQLGLAYLGPVDGHDLKSICEVLSVAKNMKAPVVVHVMTQKGRGYKFSETSPQKYHGVSKFDVLTGKALTPSKTSFSDIFGQTMVELAENDKRICTITAAMQSGTGLTPFAEQFPKRFFDVGIAEEHAVTMAAGMAKQGLKPVCTLYSTFMQRAYDQLIHDVAIDKIDITFILDRAGIVGEDGATHNGVFDVGFIRQIPNFTLLAPSNFQELSSMIKNSVYKMNGPIAIRFPRGSEGDFTEDTSEFQYKKIADGDDFCIISYGIMINQAIQAVEQLKQQGIQVSVYKLNNLSGDFSEMCKDLKDKNIIVLEDVVHNGSIGQTILEQLCVNKINIQSAKLLNTGNQFLQHGSVKELYNDLKIDSNGICEYILGEMKFE